MLIAYQAQSIDAEIAQLVEHFTRNEGVVGSSPIFSFCGIRFKCPVN